MQGVGKPSRGPSSLASHASEEDIDVDGKPSVLPTGVSSEHAAKVLIDPIYIPTPAEQNVPIATTVLPKEHALGPFVVLVEGSSSGGSGGEHCGGGGTRGGFSY
ncbi:hypothetical protein Nepgr_024851 [Nepenthes gracilis]|uniref:Uncharacterized protein n=1 Tax=Nepenthes gracilis TaxID=150966 RepID=A0AAD3XZ62_NEPGR|nr:hypothetical protein Nepgr_024851 [Nepenthes gracilis]